MPKLQSYLSRLRSEQSSDFYASVVKDAEYTEAPDLPRYKQPPRRLDKGAAPYQLNPQKAITDLYILKPLT